MESRGAREGCIRGHDPTPRDGIRMGPTASSPPALSHQKRDEVAQGIGRFLGRALRGEALGTSDTNRNPFRSRVYVACRDLSGRGINPPAVYERFGDLASVARGVTIVGSPFSWATKP